MLSAGGQPSFMLSRAAVYAPSAAKPTLASESTPHWNATNRLSTSRTLISSETPTNWE